MMKAIYKLTYLCLAVLTLAGVAGCNEDNTSDLRLDGDTWLTALQLGTRDV